MGNVPTADPPPLSNDRALSGFFEQVQPAVLGAGKTLALETQAEKLPAQVPHQPAVADDEDVLLLRRRDADRRAGQERLDALHDLAPAFALGAVREEPRQVAQPVPGTEGKAQPRSEY